MHFQQKYLEDIRYYITMFALEFYYCHITSSTKASHHSFDSHSFITKSKHNITSPLVVVSSRRRHDATHLALEVVHILNHRI